MKWIAAALCGYEIAAIASGRAPTLTTLCRTRPWLRLVLVGALAVHLYRDQNRADGWGCA